jgi:hypothetical protein
MQVIARKGDRLSPYKSLDHRWVRPAPFEIPSTSRHSAERTPPAHILQAIHWQCLYLELRDRRPSQDIRSDRGSRAECGLHRSQELVCLRIRRLPSTRLQLQYPGEDCEL